MRTKTFIYTIVTLGFIILTGILSPKQPLHKTNLYTVRADSCNCHCQQLTGNGGCGAGCNFNNSVVNNVPVGKIAMCRDNCHARYESLVKGHVCWNLCKNSCSKAKVPPPPDNSWERYDGPDFGCDTSDKNYEYYVAHTHATCACGNPVGCVVCYRKKKIKPTPTPTPTPSPSPTPTPTPTVIPHENPECIKLEITKTEGGIEKLKASFKCIIKEANNCKFVLGDGSSKTVPANNGICTLSHEYQKPGNYTSICYAIKDAQEYTSPACKQQLAVKKKPKIEDTAGGFTVPLLIGTSTVVLIGYGISKAMLPKHTL